MLSMLIDVDNVSHIQKGKNTFSWNLIFITYAMQKYHYQ